MYHSVLLIDDDDINNYVNFRLMKRMNFAENIFIHKMGSNALKFIDRLIEKKQTLPDFIFLDINMPEMNGMEFLQKLILKYRHLIHQTKIIIVSNLVRSTDLQEFVKLGVDNFLAKPLTPINLEVIRNTSR